MTHIFSGREMVELAGEELLETPSALVNLSYFIANFDRELELAERNGSTDSFQEVIDLYFQRLRLRKARTQKADCKALVCDSCRPS